ncbi:MAG: arylamine N-acetyltransferase [Clostridiales bacterium]|jgi:arylamine N-acetyltransferase|nr:arylamine N-acetyltransferase [Clostridiales bacterium]
MYTQQQIDRYLQRIGLTGPLPRSQDALTRIVQAHYVHVPYENLDIQDGVPLSLDEQDLYEKIVVRRRGGYCFELNAALGDLLIGMGYQLVRLTGRFIMGEPEGITPMRRHHILLVTLPEGQYLVDAGIMRESCRAAHPFIVGAEQFDGVANYRLREAPFFGYVMEQAYPGEAYRPMFGFTLEPQHPVDFVMPSFFCEKHPDSPFNKGRMVGIRNQTGSYNLVGNTFKTLVGGTIVTQREIPDAEVPGVLADVFGLRLHR